MKVVIVGGVAGGASAAARIRRLSENAEIVVFERSGFMSYANCGLPYSSAKDPVNMAGFIMENVITGKISHFHYEDIEKLRQDENAFLIDSRTPYEYANGHAEGFFNIPVDDLRERLSEIPKDKKIYVMCQSGLRSYLASRILIGNGYDAVNYAGGYRFYSMIERGIEQSKTANSCGMDK